MAIKIEKPHYISEEVWIEFVKVRRMAFEFESQLEFAIAFRWFVEGYYRGINANK